jgi:hypothetical protein
MISSCRITRKMLDTRTRGPTFFSPAPIPERVSGRIAKNLASWAVQQEGERYPVVCRNIVIVACPAVSSPRITMKPVKRSLGAREF